jgi:hypothetical protein
MIMMDTEVWQTRCRFDLPTTEDVIANITLDPNSPIIPNYMPIQQLLYDIVCVVESRGLALMIIEAYAIASINNDNIDDIVIEIVDIMQSDGITAIDDMIFMLEISLEVSSHLDVIKTIKRIIEFNEFEFNKFNNGIFLGFTPQDDSALMITQY